MKETQKPILLVTFLPGTAVKMTRRFRQPVFGNPERAVGSMSGLIEYGRFVRNAREGYFRPPTRKQRVKPFFLPGNRALDEHQGKQILAGFGIPVTQEGLANTRLAAHSIAQEIGFPVAAKILSADILHKTDQGGVILAIQNEAELDRAISQLEERFPGLKDPEGPVGLLIQEMVPKGIEVLLGMVNDLHFGPLLVLGLGGILVEVLRDVSFAKPPITAFQAKQLWRSLRGSVILDGVRGKPPADLPALIAATVQFSELIDELGREFEEIDINPLMVLPDQEGVKALDALFIRKELI